MPRAAVLSAALATAAVPSLAQAPAAPDVPAPDTHADVPPPAWLKRDRFSLVAIDKVTGRSQALSGNVGDTVAFGSLSIAVRACMVRPPDRAADATAFLDITDSHPGEPGFHGWMIVSAPFASILEHPLYDVRLAGCGA